MPTSSCLYGLSDIFSLLVLHLVRLIIILIHHLIRNSPVLHFIIFILWDVSQTGMQEPCNIVKMALCLKCGNMVALPELFSLLKVYLCNGEANKVNFRLQQWSHCQDESIRSPLIFFCDDWLSRWQAFRCPHCSEYTETETLIYYALRSLQADHFQEWGPYRIQRPQCTQIF